MKPTLKHLLKSSIIVFFLQQTSTVYGQFITSTFSNSTTFNVGPNAGNASLYPSTNKHSEHFG